MMCRLSREHLDFNVDEGIMASVDGPYLLPKLSLVEAAMQLSLLLSREYAIKLLTFVTKVK